MTETGIAFFETGESYGRNSRGAGMSAEELLAPCLEELRLDRVRTTVATSFNAPRFGASPTTIVQSLQGSLQRLQVQDVEVFQVRPPMLGGLDAMAKGMVECVDEGLCTQLGVVDMGAGALKSMIRKVERRGEFLVSNKVQYNTLSTYILVV